MLTILDILKKTTEFFEKKGISNARLEAEWLLAHGLGCDRLGLYLQFERVLTEGEIQNLRTLTIRRGNHEPLQYIMGTVDFHNIKLTVDKRALIPRPETEELIGIIQNRLTIPSAILDLGTGTGAIAIALSKVFPAAKVLAVDRSTEALELTKLNISQTQSTNVSTLESNWLEKVNGEFDCIVSNPPYLTEQEWQNAQIEVKDHEPLQALVANNAGLADLAHILKEAKKFLKPKGLLALETGIEHHEALNKLAKELGYSELESIQDVHKRPRFFLARV